MSAATVAEEMIRSLDRIMDRRPLSAFDRGLVLSALKRTYAQAYAEGQTAEHGEWVTRQERSDTRPEEER